MHVCEELRPDPSCDRLCGNCIVRGLLTTPEHLTAFCPQRHVTPVVTGLLAMTLLEEIQNIVCTIDADCLLAGKWTWSFEFEKRIDFRVVRSAPKKGTRVPKGANESDSDKDDDDSGEDNDDGLNNGNGVARVSTTSAVPLGERRIQPGRAAKDATAIRKLAVAKRLFPVRKELIAKKKAAQPKQAAQPKKIPTAPSKDPVLAPRKNNAAKNPSPPRVMINRAKLAKKPQKRTARTRFNHLDLLVKVKRDNVCFFYVIGEKCNILPVFCHRCHARSDPQNSHQSQMSPRMF